MIFGPLSSSNDGALVKPDLLPHVSFSHPPALSTFLSLVTLLFCCHLTNALILEHLLSGAHIFKCSIFFTCFQCCGYILLALAARMFIRSQPRCTPLRTYAVMGILQAVTMAFSTLSIHYLNFPTVVIFKSAKLLPVMTVNAVWLGRRQHPLDVIAALLMCLGLMLFTAADSKLHPDFHPKGVLLLLCALCADACISNLQEATMRLRNTPVLEMVLYGHTFALAFLLPAAVVGGELAASLFWLSSHPSAFGLMVLYSFCGFLGVSSVFGIVESFGCVVAVATTTFRKAVTMLISFLVFPKPFSIMYIYGSAVFLAGITCFTISKQPGYFPAFAALLQRFGCLYQTAMRKVGNGDETGV